MKTRIFSAVFLLVLLSGVASRSAVAHIVIPDGAGAHLLRPAAQTEDEEPFAHPSLDGPERILDTSNFRIHYTLQGRNAVKNTDRDGNGQPDYVDAVAQTLEHVRSVEVDAFGWAAPPPDGAWGGDSRYDVYLYDIEDALGYVDAGMPETIIGDNPNTPNVRESRAGFSVMGLDNDYADAEGDPLATMRATVAHEFHHAIQAGYDAEEPMDWLWEATATWMQDEVYNDNNEAIEDLLGVFKAGPVCQLAYGNEDAWERGGDPYGLWILLRLISERYGHETVRAIWEAARNQDGMAAMETALTGVGANLDDLLAEFPIALLLRDFEEGRAYPTVRLEGVARTGTFQPESGVGLSGQAFVEIDASGTVTVRLDGAGLQGTLVGLRNGRASLFPLRGGEVTVDADSFARLYLVVRNPILPTAESVCRISPYSVHITGGGQAASPPATQPAPNFQPPVVEPSLSEDMLPDEKGCEYGPEGVDWPGEEGEAPASVLAQTLAAQIGSDYQIDDLFDLPADELDPQEVDWMMPGGDGAVALLRTQQADEFEVLLSNSPYDTLDAWLNAVSYRPLPGELRTIAGAPLLLEVWDGGDISATFMRNGFFYVVSGQISAATLLQFVRSLS